MGLRLKGKTELEKIGLWKLNGFNFNQPKVDS